MNLATFTEYVDRQGKIEKARHFSRTRALDSLAYAKQTGRFAGGIARDSLGAIVCDFGLCRQGNTPKAVSKRIRLG